MISHPPPSLGEGKGARGCHLAESLRPPLRFQQRRQQLNHVALSPLWVLLPLCLSLSEKSNQPKKCRSTKNRPGRIHKKARPTQCNVPVFFSTSGLPLRDHRAPTPKQHHTVTSTRPLRIALYTPTESVLIDGSPTCHVCRVSDSLAATNPRRPLWSSVACKSAMSPSPWHLAHSFTKKSCWPCYYLAHTHEA